MWPGLLLTLGWIWKDVFFAGLMFCAFGILANAFYSGAKLNWWQRIAIFVLAMFGFGVKINGLTVLPFLFGFWLYVEGWWQNRWPIRLAAIAALTVGAVAGAKLLVSFDHVVKMNQYQYILGYDLLGISVRTGQMLVPSYLTSEISDNPEVIAKLYSPNNFVPFVFQHGEFKLASPEELADLNHRWFSAVLQHPTAYLAHRLDVFRSLMRIGESTPIVGFMTPGNPVTEFLWPVLVAQKWLFYPWIYAIVFIVVEATLLAGGRHNPLCLALGGAVVAFVAPHFFIAPGWSYRYFLFAYIVTILLTLIAAGELALKMNSKRLADGRAQHTI